MDPIMGILASTMRATVGEIFSPPSNLTECAPPLLYQPFSVGQSLCGIKLVAHERQVYDNQTLFHTSGYCFCVVQHVCHGYGYGGIVAKHHHTQNISHQHKGYTSLVCQLCRCVVVGGNHRYLFTARFHISYVYDAHFSHEYLFIGWRWPQATWSISPW